MKKILFLSFYFLHSNELSIGINTNSSKYFFSINILINQNLLTLLSSHFFEAEIGLIKNIYKNLNFLFSLNSTFQVNPFQFNNNININLLAMLKFSKFNIKFGTSIESNLSKILSIKPYLSIQQKYINIKFKYLNILKKEKNQIKIQSQNINNHITQMKILEDCFKNIKITNITNKNIKYTYKNKYMHEIQLELIKLINKNSNKLDEKTVKRFYNDKEFLEKKQKFREFLYFNTTYIDSIYSKNYYENKYNYFDLYEKDPILINFLHNSFYEIINYINESIKIKNILSNENLQCTAIHEIGHALIIRSYNKNEKEKTSIELKSITIDKNGNGLTSSSHHRKYKKQNKNTPILMQTITKILINLGGLAAEKYINNHIQNTISTDLKHAKTNLKYLKDNFSEIYNNPEKLYDILNIQKTFYQQISKTTGFKKSIKLKEIFHITDKTTQNSLVIDKKINYFNENELNILDILFNHTYSIIEKFFNHPDNTLNIIKLKNKIIENGKVTGDEIKKILNI